MYRRDNKRSSLLEAVPTKVIQKLASQCDLTKLEQLALRKDTYTIVQTTSTKCTRLYLDLT